MLDISNKLHALVDEFVSNLSSECDSLAHTFSSQAATFLAHDLAAELPKASKPCNRTATEVLIGLRRPSEIPSADTQHKGGKSHVEQAKANSKEGKFNFKDGGRSSQPVELLSSDHSSDDARHPPIKFSKKPLPKKQAPKLRKSSSRGSPPKIHIHSPSRTFSSSHSMDYGYEEDTKSVAAKDLDPVTPYTKLKWPEDIEELEPDEEFVKKSDSDATHSFKETYQKKVRDNRDDDMSMEHHLSMEEGDDSSEDEDSRNPIHTESDAEELVVLPKVPVKRKLLKETKPSERKTQRGRPKSRSPQMKKHKTPQIDASVITQLEFGRRPNNSVSIPNNFNGVSMNCGIDRFDAG